METTVEHLLAMSSGAGAGGAAPDSAPANPEYKPPVPTSAPLTNEPATLPAGKHTLPDDFLRPPSYYKGAAKSQQLEEDEMLAKILQDSLFMAELQQHPEWILEQQRAAKRNKKKSSSKNPRNWNVGQTGSINQEMSQAEYTRQLNRQNTSNNERYQNFKSKFAGLGVSARGKLAALAARMKGNKQEQAPATEYHALNSLDDDIDDRNRQKSKKGGFTSID